MTKNAMELKKKKKDTTTENGGGCYSDRAVRQASEWVTLKLATQGVGGTACVDSLEVGRGRCDSGPECMEPSQGYS